VGFVGLLWLTLVVLVYTFCVLKGANKILLTYQIFFFFYNFSGCWLAQKLLSDKKNPTRCYYQIMALLLSMFFLASK
jgi:hypothetical protein